MKKCPNCGALMEADVNFCTKCGTDLRNINNTQANKSELKPNVNQPIKKIKIVQEKKSSTTIGNGVWHHGNAHSQNLLGKVGMVG